MTTPQDDSTPDRLPPAEVEDEASQLPARIDRYGKAKERAGVMLAHIEGLPVDDAFRSPTDPGWVGYKLSRCGNYLKFRHYFTVGKVRLSAAVFCKQHLLCPLCAIRRGSKALKSYLARWEVVAKANPALRLYLVTLTVQNGESLPERFRHLHRSYQQLLKRRMAPRTISVLRDVAGGVATYEVTNRGKGWHPHVHALIASETPIDQQQLRDEWEGITGDSFMCDVREVDQVDLVSGFCEVFKYAVKFGDLEPADNWLAYLYLRGRRLLTSFGCFRGVQVPEALTDELLDELPFVEILYRYTWAKKVYEVAEVSQVQEPPSSSTPNRGPQARSEEAEGLARGSSPPGEPRTGAPESGSDHCHVRNQRSEQS